MRQMIPIEAAFFLLKMGDSAEVAQQYDLPTYLQEALKQTADKRKKREGANKLRQQINDHEEDGSIYDYYRDNHPDWFNRWREGGGE